jgi:hypothetical protein
LRTICDLELKYLKAPDAIFLVINESLIELVN